MTDFRPRRSCLYMPGANERALEKAKSLPADMLILDLEDAVAPSAKEDARRLVCSMVKQREYGAREVIIRINDLDTDWGADDLAASVGASPDGILAPKVSTAQEVVSLDTAMQSAGASKEMSLWVMIETPLAILNIQRIAAAAERTRLVGLVIGTNDLAKEMLAVPTPDRLAFQSALSQTVIAARAYGLKVIDGVFNDFRDPDGLQAECTQGKVLGFDGKTLIHPAQIGPCNEIFAPATEEIQHAQDIVDEFSKPENQGKGVITVNGKMTELLHLEQAKRILAIQGQIQVLAG